MAIAGSMIDLLREHQLLEPAQLEELARTPDVQDTEPRVLGQCLMEMGWLTAFQVDRLCLNRPQDLVLGPYRLLDRLGQGETGPAFQARKPGKAGIVTLKIIPKPRLADPQLLARFQQEVRIAAQLQHPYIAPVAAVGQHGNLFLFAREFVPGADLGRLVREVGALPTFLACNAVRQAAVALQYAHDKGLSHRRIKASNLIAVDQAGSESVVKLVDFGLGQLKAGATAGLDVPGDLAALGETLSFLVTGQSGGSGVPAEVAEVVRRLSPKAPDRFTSARQVADALEPLSREPAPVVQAASINGTPEPAFIPMATAAVPMAVAAPVLCEAVAVPSESVVITGAATPVVVPEPVALEGIAVPVMGSVGATAWPSAEPVEATVASEPEPVAVVAAVAAPVVASLPLDEPAVASVADAEREPTVSVVDAPMIELLGAGIAGEKPDEDDWFKKKPESEPAPVVAEASPIVAEPAIAEPSPVMATEVPPPPPQEGFAAELSNPLVDAPEVPAPSPGGYFTDQAPSTSVAAEETVGYSATATEELAPRRAPAKKKWSRSSIMWIIVGALLHLVAAVILVIAVIALMKRENAPKNNKPGVPAKKVKARAEKQTSPLLALPRYS